MLHGGCRLMYHVENKRYWQCVWHGCWISKTSNQKMIHSGIIQEISRHVYQCWVASEMARDLTGWKKCACYMELKWNLCIHSGHSVKQVTGTHTGHLSYNGLRLSLWTSISQLQSQNWMNQMDLHTLTRTGRIDRNRSQVMSFTIALILRWQYQFSNHSIKWLYLLHRAAITPCLFTHQKPMNAAS